MKNRRWAPWAIAGVLLLTIGVLLQAWILGGRTMRELNEREYEKAERPISYYAGAARSPNWNGGY